MSSSSARRSRNQVPPLPSLIRASAEDAGNASMRKADRTKWSEDDYNAAAETQERLIRACYGSDRDTNEPRMCFLRFQVAEQMERSGDFHLESDLTDICAVIDATLAQSFGVAV